MASFTSAPNPRFPMSAPATRLGVLLGPFDLGSEGLGGWIILDEPELYLTRGDILVPDLAGWRREHMPALPRDAALTLPPDWVCEVLSPSTEVRDHGRKMEVYAREGVKHLWFVDPRIQTLEVFALRDGTWERLGSYTGDAQVRAEPFEVKNMNLHSLWGR
ncbi:Uma2 family endonuclease [Myxococcus dinghuensis]|uniref:Uma2 family endonuclease n=1 Tax=Myxococcus dinghuensis TaxID=2906761 RepID=UPI002B202EEE|nr:Uma2 family endonuclease [Myxococcus dinghuensis]